MAEESKKKRLDKLERKVIEKLIKTNVRKRMLDVSEEEVLFFKNNPLELDRITSTIATKKIFLGLAVLLGTILVAISIAIKTRMDDPILNGIITDLMFEGGVALWGAAVTVYMLEIMLHRQEIINRQYRRTILKKIDEHSKPEGKE